MSEFEDNLGSVYSEKPSLIPQYSTGRLAEAIRGESVNGQEGGQVAHLKMDFNAPDGNVWQRYRGLLSPEIREFLSVLNVDGASSVPGYIYFLLESINEPRDEKAQVTETIGDNFVAHFFGERARTWQYTGRLYNTRQNPWYNAWNLLYDNLFRGTKIADVRVPAQLVYGNKIVEGAIMRSQTSVQAATENSARLNFSFLVSKERIIRDRFFGDPDERDLTSLKEIKGEINTSVKNLESARDLRKERLKEDRDQKQRIGIDEALEEGLREPTSSNTQQNFQQALDDAPDSDTVRRQQEKRDTDDSGLGASNPKNLREQIEIDLELQRSTPKGYNGSYGNVKRLGQPPL